MSAHFSAFSQFTDSLLLHIRLNQRRRNIPVLRNSLTRYTARHLRIKCLVQFIFAGPVYNNALKNRAALLCRTCADKPTCVAERYLALRTGRKMGGHIGPPLRKKKSSAVSLISQRSHVGNLRQTLQGKRGDSQEGGKPQVVYPLVRPRGVSALPRRGTRHVPAARRRRNSPLRFSEKHPAR